MRLLPSMCSQSKWDVKDFLVFDFSLSMPGGSCSSTEPAITHIWALGSCDHNDNYLSEMPTFQWQITNRFFWTHVHSLSTLLINLLTRYTLASLDLCDFGHWRYQPNISLKTTRHYVGTPLASWWETFLKAQQKLVVWKQRHWSAPNFCIVP